mgnify:CR=1 FL=1
MQLLANCVYFLNGAGLCCLYLLTNAISGPNTAFVFFNIGCKTVYRIFQSKCTSYSSVSVTKCVLES